MQQTHRRGTAMAKASRTAGSVDPDEVARFAAMAAEWWDPDGKFRPLHKLNPVRVRFVRDRACARFGRDPAAARPLDGLRLIDIGCGGGLVCEPMARLGAAVTGIDAAAENIGIARSHAEAAELGIDYRAETAEALVAAGERFDIVLSLEVVEHVADVAGFVAACCALTRPGGLIVMATLNRTAKAFAMAIVGAEYVMRWLPRGTHDWRKFLRPSELAAALTRGGARVEEIAGVSYNPLFDEWRLTGDLSVNYMIAAGMPAAS
jgi:2-polyprenyl-6-hydroxyphenyl methylase/3-demethylubiquinone-9 3-methyltransferase